MMTANPSRFISSALLAALLLFGTHAGADEKKITVTRDPKAGKVIVFKSTSKGEVAGAEFQVERGMKVTIKAVKETGAVTLDRLMLDGTLTLNGSAQDVKAQPLVTETRDKTGKLTAFKHIDTPSDIFAPEISQIIAILDEPIIGAAGIAEGDAWETTVDNPAAKDKITIKTSYLGIEKVGDVEMWKFKQSASPVVNRDGTKMTADTLFWLNPKTGVTEKSVATLKDVPSMYGPMTMETTLKFVKIEDAKPEPAEEKKA